MLEQRRFELVYYGHKRYSIRDPEQRPPKNTRPALLVGSVIILMDKGNETLRFKTTHLETIVIPDDLAWQTRSGEAAVREIKIRFKDFTFLPWESA